MTLDVVKDSLWVDVKAYTTAEGARNADARRVAQVVGKSTEVSETKGATDNLASSGGRLRE